MDLSSVRLNIKLETCMFMTLSNYKTINYLLLVSFHIPH